MYHRGHHQDSGVSSNVGDLTSAIVNRAVERRASIVSYKYIRPIGDSISRYVDRNAEPIGLEARAAVRVVYLSNNYLFPSRVRESVCTGLSYRGFQNARFVRSYSTECRHAKREECIRRERIVNVERVTIYDYIT